MLEQRVRMCTVRCVVELASWRQEWLKVDTDLCRRSSGCDKTKQKLMVAHLVSYPPLVNFVWSLPSSQKPASEPDTEPDESKANPRV